MKTKPIIITVFILSALAFKVATNWVVDSQKSKVQFEASGPMGKVNGSFSGLKSTVVFDPNNLAGSSIKASVEVSTIETGIALRNSDLRNKEEWFNAAKYPQVTIQSKKIEKTTTGYKMTADLTIKNVTRPVVIGFNFTPSGNGGLFTSLFTINREDFGLGKAGGVVGKEVTVNLEVPVSK